MRERIVVVCPNPGVSETFIKAHLNLLPYLVTPLYRWRFPYSTTDSGYVAFWPGLARAIGELLNIKCLVTLSTKIGNQQVAKWLQATQTSLVLAEYGPLGAGIADACKLADIPLVVIFHGFDAYKFDTLKCYRSSYDKLFGNAAALVVVSEPMRNQLIRLGAPKEIISVNPCGVDPQRFYPSNTAETPPHFLAVGRFVGKKGPLQTIKAFELAHKIDPTIRLKMIGTGPLLSCCQDYANEVDLDDAISFLGACSHASVQAELRRVRAVVQHSLCCSSGDQEGTPVALIEAQMAGLPVVSTLHAGIPGVVIEGRTGFLVPEGDIVGMAEAIIHLAHNPQLAAQMGMAGRAHALQKLTMERHINDLASTIGDAISRKFVSSPG